MNKNDIIALASISFMPTLEWDIDKSIRYAERLHERLLKKGYGKPPARKSGENTEKSKVYKPLSTPLQDEEKVDSNPVTNPLLADIAHLKRLHKAQPSDALAQQIKKLEAEIQHER